MNYLPFCVLFYRSRIKQFPAGVFDILREFDTDSVKMRLKYFYSVVLVN